MEIQVEGFSPPMVTVKRKLILGKLKTNLIVIFSMLLEVWTAKFLHHLTDDNICGMDF
jgi:hypothetical protein